MLGGMSIVEGGAGRLADTLAALVRRFGGDVRCDAAVTGIDVGADGVRAVLVGDERIPTSRVVSTAVLPITAGLLPADRRPASVARSARDYRFGPGTFMLHLAMDGEIPWADPRLGEHAYVHVGPYVDDMARAYGQSLAGDLPEEPLLVVGQTSVVDRTRVLT